MRDRDEVLLGVERQRLVERDVRRNLQIVDEQRVAVGRRARDALAGDVGAAAADVLDDEVLAELGRELRRDLARHLVGRPAGRVGHDDGDGPRRIGLRLRGRNAGESRDNATARHEPCPCLPPKRATVVVAKTIAHRPARWGGGTRPTRYSGLMLPAAMILIHFSISRSTWERNSSVVVPIGWKPRSSSALAERRVLHRVGAEICCSFSTIGAGVAAGTIRPISLAESTEP